MIRKVSVLLVLSGVVGFSVMMIAQDNKSAKNSPAEDATKETTDLFKVPDGTDAETLRLYVERLQTEKPTERSLEGVLAHIKKMDQALQEILGREIEESLFVDVAQLRYQVLAVLRRYQDGTAEAKQQALLEKLKQDARKSVSALAAKLELFQRVNEISSLTDVEITKLIDDISAMIKSAEKDNLDSLRTAVGMAMQTVRMLEMTESEKIAEAYKSFAAALKTRDEEVLKAVAESMEGSVRRLPGNSIEVAGTTIKGEPFNINQYKDKVVLVDFWATWCDPCVAELPHVKEMYDAYHDKGFEVVGISLDSDRAELEKFLSDEGIAWVTLFEEAPESGGWDNKIAKHYGVTGIPTALLVGRDGKIVHSNARGPLLTAELEKLFGPTGRSVDPKPETNAPN